MGGPFAKLLERAGIDTDDYLIDLEYMKEYPVREDLVRLGCKINFSAMDGNLSVSSIEYDGQSVEVGDDKWEFTERIALCSLLTHLTVWRHGMQYHVAGVAPFVPATYNMPPNHPIRRLLAAHVSETLSTNYYTHLTLRRNGYDVTGFSFLRQVIFRYYDDGAKAFEISHLDVRADSARRRIPETLNYPYLSQALRYYELFETYVKAYVDYYYPEEHSVGQDSDLNSWFDALDRHFVNGIRSYVPSMTKENLIKLCTLFIYTVSVEHEQNTMWDYAVFLPATVHEDGSPQTVGEVQTVMNFQLLISSATNRIMNDYSHLALDEGAANIMRELGSRLRSLQAKMESDPHHYWTIYPKDLEASVSA